MALIVRRRILSVKDLVVELVGGDHRDGDELSDDGRRETNADKRRAGASTGNAGFSGGVGFARQKRQELVGMAVARMRIGIDDHGTRGDSEQPAWRRGGRDHPAGGIGGLHRMVVDDREASPRLARTIGCCRACPDQTDRSSSISEPRRTAGKAHGVVPVVRHAHRDRSSFRRRSSDVRPPPLPIGSARQPRFAGQKHLEFRRRCSPSC